MEYDPVRAIKEIVALDPKSDKLDLLLSRIINSREAADDQFYQLSPQEDIPAKQAKSNQLREIKLVDSIAKRNITAKPYFWNIAAGYLHYMHNDFTEAGNFYAAARKQFPSDDNLVMAQYKLLSIFLDLKRIKKINTAIENRLIEPLNWLKDLEEGKVKIEKLRIASCADLMSRMYLAQGDTLKANIFGDSVGFYTNRANVQKLINLLNKPNKSAFEKTMLRYYHHTIDELYYHQGTILTYDEDLDGALKKITKANDNTQLPANPFNGNINDCHDCDAAAPQKRKFTAVTFLKTLQAIKKELQANKNVYKNALLMANAYYNINYYGNARTFYQSDIISLGDVIYREYDKNPFIDLFTSQQIAEKYYLLARDHAETNEQRAKCTFMTSKCEHNSFYNQSDITAPPTIEQMFDKKALPTYYKYFAELKAYSKTNYYKEVLKECGYFKSYIAAKK
jgi:hypothetical protein